jgi:hypothetical protein
MSRSLFRVFVGVDQTEPDQFFTISSFFLKGMPARALLGREVLSWPWPRTKYITRQMRLPPKVARFSTSGLLFLCRSLLLVLKQPAFHVIDIEDHQIADPNEWYAAIRGPHLDRALVNFEKCRKSANGHKSTSGDF